MSPFFKILAFISIVAVNEACNVPTPQFGVQVTQDNRGCGNNCWNGGRRKRAASAKVQDVLLEFDIRLTEELASEIKDLSEEEKGQFIDDLEKMNNAVKLEAKSIEENSDGSIQNTEVFLREISDRISSDFSGKKWFNRLRSIAGEQIQKLMSQLAQNSN